MKLKLNENIGKRCLELFSAASHDAATAQAQNLSAATDADLISACRTEGRALVTLDLDFSNPLIFPPVDYPGIAVLRLPRKPTHDDLVDCVITLISTLERETLSGHLWSVERGRVRVYQPPD